MIYDILFKTLKRKLKHIILFINNKDKNLKIQKGG